MYIKVLFIPILLIGTCSGIPATTEDTTPSVTAPEQLTPLQPTRNGDTYSKCGAGKECVREYLCLRGNVSEDVSGLIDLHNNDEEPCPALETCCSIEDKVKKPIIQQVDTPNGCGYRKIDNIKLRIVGNDNEAEFGEFPWMVAILRKEEVNDRVLNVYQCGGSLITPQVVITGAHCVQDRPANAFKVRAGEWETNSKNELYPDQDRNVVEVIVHDHFNKGSLYNDIALLFLDEPFNLAPHINTICLPPATLNFDSSRCFATGWGKDQFENGQYQNVLKKIDLPVVPNAECLTSLRKTRLGERFELHMSFVCAGGERGKDTCKGDGGSPLVCPMATDPNRFFQVGIVAWGIACGEENVPAVYASVPYLRAWIDEELAYKRVDPKSFTA